MRCIDCRSDKDIESAHYLPQKRFPMSALWRINLYYGCSKCNGKLGDKIKWSIQAVKLLSIYAMIKLIKYIAIALVVVIFGRFLYLDYQRGPWDTRITYQVYIDIKTVIDMI